MATYHEAPELAHQNQAPEVYHQQQQQHYQQQQPGYETSPTYPQTPSTGYVKQDIVGSPHSQSAAVDGGPPYGAVSEKKHHGRTVCGCGIILFLTIIIALLSIAVIALAAVTGVEAGKANTANNALAAKIAQDGNATTVTVTVTASGTATSATPTPPTIIDGGCAANAKGVNGTTYMTPFSNNANFTRYCNADTPNGPILTVVTTNIEGCMDTCASWNTNKNITVPCEAVSFIPAWENKTFAIAGNAAGDCYLKPGPVKVDTLTVPNIGTPVDAAILQF